MSKPKRVYYLKEETDFEDGTRRSWTETVYESCSDALGCIVREMTSSDKSDVSWKIDFLESRHGAVVIVGEGKFESTHDEDFGELVDGKRTYILQEIIYREAKKA